MGNRFAVIVCLGINSRQIFDMPQLCSYHFTRKSLKCVSNLNYDGKSSLNWALIFLQWSKIPFTHYHHICFRPLHYTDVIMGALSSQITSFTIVYSTIYSDADQRKHHISASLAFLWGNHRGPVNSPHKWPVTRKMFPFDDGIMIFAIPFRIPAPCQAQQPAMIIDGKRGGCISTH